MILLKNNLGVFNHISSHFFPALLCPTRDSLWLSSSFITLRFPSSSSPRSGPRNPYFPLLRPRQSHFPSFNPALRIQPYVAGPASLAQLALSTTPEATSPARTYRIPRIHIHQQQPTSRLIHHPHNLEHRLCQDHKHPSLKARIHLDQAGSRRSCRLRRRTRS